MTSAWQITKGIKVRNDILQEIRKCTFSYRDPVHGVAFVVLVPTLPFLATLHLVIPSYFEIYSPYQAQNLRSDYLLLRSRDF
jgi:hypothetical protein